MSDYSSYTPDDIRLFMEDNPVHTFVYLTGNAKALEMAEKIIMALEKTGIEPEGQTYVIKPDEIRSVEDGENRWFEIVFDNHVPQIYEKVKAVKGIEKVLFVVYSSFDKCMNTNDEEGVMWKRRDMFGIPIELEVEFIDDYPYTFDNASTNYC